MSLQMCYSNIMAHMPSAYGLGKNIIFNKVQFSSVQTAARNTLFNRLMDQRRMEYLYIHSIIIGLKNFKSS